MMIRRPYPENLPDLVKKALDVFSDEEIEALEAFFDHETREFLFIGFIGPGGKMTEFAESEKAAALEILNVQYRLELKYREGYIHDSVIVDLEKRIRDNAQEAFERYMRKINTRGSL